MTARTMTASTAGVLMVLVAGNTLAAEIDTIDWSRVPTRDVALFYPGQATFQWLRSSDHPGAQAVTSGTACVTCHKGQEQRLGDALVKGGKLEPTPPAGKEGTKQLNVQVAYR